MKVVILCGGKGTRIRDVSEELPKPMIPIGEFPILWHIMNIYGSHGFEEFVLCLGYQGWHIKQYFLDYRLQVSDVTVSLGDTRPVKIEGATKTPGWTVTLAETGLDAMTGCRLARVGRYLENQTFMLTYGDGVGNVDITSLLAFHRSHGKLATVTSVRPVSRFGELTVEGGRVTAFQEKPQTSAGLINGGFLVCEPGVLDYVSEEESCSFEQEPLRRLARDGQLMTYVHEGFWQPMDTSREYQLLNHLWATGEAPWTR